MKIIRHGKVRFKKTCTKCKCRFSYTLTDLMKKDEKSVVYCPECREQLMHE